MDIQGGIERYWRYHRASNSTAKTLAGHRYALGKLVAAVGGETPLEALSADSLRGVLLGLSESGLAPHSVASVAKAIKAWSRWLADEEYVPKDPFARVRLPRTDDAAKPIFTVAEVEALLASCKGPSRTARRDAACILLLFSTGLRATELCNLRVEDVDWEQGSITVRRGKGGKGRVVPLGPRVALALQRYLDSRLRRPRPGIDALFLTVTGKSMTYAALEQALEVRGQQAGVHANPHKFRHTCAVLYLRNGGKLETLRLLLGHSDLKMTLHYARLAGVDVCNGHQQADPANLLKGRV